MPKSKKTERKPAAKAARKAKAAEPPAEKPPRKAPRFSNKTLAKRALKRLNRDAGAHVVTETYVARHMREALADMLSDSLVDVAVQPDPALLPKKRMRVTRNVIKTMQQLVDRRLHDMVVRARLVAEAAGHKQLAVEHFKAASSILAVGQH